MSTAEIAEPTAVPKKIRIAKTAGWIAAFLALLALFTVSKLPDDRIGGLILEKASETLSSGATRFRFSADRTRISLLLLGRIPRTSDVIEWGDWKFEVVDMDGHRVDKVLVTEEATEEAA